jgi:hypothetical protein
MQAMVMNRAISILALVGVCSAAIAAIEPADTIYYGGDILTMVGNKPQYVQRLAVIDGKIVYAGSAKGLGGLKGAGTKVVNLNGKTLIPGFVDAHSHYASVGIQATSANQLPPPDGPVQSIADLQKTMRNFIATEPLVKKYGVAIGFNYDDSQLKELRSPTAAELDAISTEIPIVVIHQSGHLGVLNSVALKKVGITAASKDPQGGVIRRKPGSQEPNGVLEETAYFGAVFSLVPKYAAEDVTNQLKRSLAIYVANGFTTVQEGRAEGGNVKDLETAAKAGAFSVDIVAYPGLDSNAKDPALHGPLMNRYYKNHYRIGGVKLTFDGSPQGKTAYFTAPYYQVPAGQPKSYRGYPAFKPADAQKWVDMAFKNKWQLLVHANGDAAIDELIATVAKAKAKYPNNSARTVLIHGQYLRKDQVPQLKKLGIFPSLYPMHTFYWGDWHRQSVAGPKRAENISPTGWVLQNGMKFTIHSDAPVTFPNSMRILDSAVNRTTRTNYVLGPKQRLSPYIALKAMTIWSAYQHFEESAKGTLEPGKLADFVILNQNPLKIAPAKIINIKVMETIKDGKTVFPALK